MHARLVRWSLVAGLAAAFFTPAVEASVSLRNLRVGNAPSAEPPLVRFPPKTAGLTVHFDYVDATNERVAVVVTGLAGISVFRSEQRLAGSGSIDLPVTGPMIYSRLAQAILDSGNQSQDNVRQAKAATEVSVANGYLDGAYLGLYRDQLSAEMMLVANPPEAHRVLLADIKRLATEGLGLIVRAKQADSLNTKRPLIDQLGTSLETLLAKGSTVQAKSAEATGAIIPPTGTRDQDSYVVQLQIGGVPGSSAEFWVLRDQKVFLPFMAKSHAIR